MPRATEHVRRHFTIIEDVNKAFLGASCRRAPGCMKPEGLRGGVQNLGADWNTWVTPAADRDATPHERERVMEFGQLVSQTDLGVRSRIGSYLDIEEFLRFLAVNAFIANGDSYLGGGHLYIYLDPADDKFASSRGIGCRWDRVTSAGPDSTAPPVTAIRRSSALGAGRSGRGRALQDDPARAGGHGVQQGGNDAAVTRSKAPCRSATTRRAFPGKPRGLRATARRGFGGK